MKDSGRLVYPEKEYPTKDDYYYDTYEDNDNSDDDADDYYSLKESCY
jgi:hypothetical protein